MKTSHGTTSVKQGDIGTQQRLELGLGGDGIDRWPLGWVEPFEIFKRGQDGVDKRKVLEQWFSTCESQPLYLQKYLHCYS